MRILVTGATGFIGSALCRRLCDDGHKVAAFHRPTGITRGIQDLPVEVLTGDLLDQDSVMNAVLNFGPEVIYHLGAQTRAEDTHFTRRMTQINVLGTRYVFMAALRRGVSRVVLMSSAATLGLPEIFRSHDRKPILLNESRVASVKLPLWPFAKSKYLAEMEAQSAGVSGLDVVTVNPFMVVGERDWYRRKSSILMRLKQKPPAVMIRGGLNVIPLEDVVLGLVNACEYGKRGERYLLCGENMTYMDFCRMCAEAGGFEPPKLMLENEFLAEMLGRTGAVNQVRPECLDKNVFFYADRYFYYNPRLARVELRMPPCGDVAAAVKKSYQWFEANA